MQQKREDEEAVRREQKESRAGRNNAQLIKYKEEGELITIEVKKMSEKEQLIRELEIKLEDLLWPIIRKYDKLCRYHHECGKDNEKIYCREIPGRYDELCFAYEIYIEKEKINEIRENAHILYVFPKGLEIREGKKYIIFRAEPGFWNIKQ